MPICESCGNCVPKLDPVLVYGVEYAICKVCKREWTDEEGEFMFAEDPDINWNTLTSRNQLTLFNFIKFPTVKVVAPAKKPRHQTIPIPIEADPPPLKPEAEPKVSKVISVMRVKLKPNRSKPVVEIEQISRLRLIYYKLQSWLGR